MTPNLDAADFADFYRAVHGYPPLPWQLELATRLLAGEPWPGAIDVATGLGKTSTIDIAVFAAAARAPHARRRTFFIVDRRLVVDEAFDHAQTLAAALATPEQLDCSPAQRRLVADIAQRLTPDAHGTALEVERMRGGTTWSWRWVQRPDAPAVVVGTVDQIGSRVLLRGYGLSAHLAPIDAALVGTDSLILCDEAHLSPALLRTLERAVAPGDRLSAPVVVPLSATTTNQPQGRVHSTSQADADHPVAGARLASPRRARLIEAKGATALIKQMASWAHALAHDPSPGHVVLTVCNTVARARAVYTELGRLGVGEQDRVLLIGRTRPIDRDHLLATAYPQMRLGRDRSRPSVLHVVATQTVEVGANLDADALVSESASYSALIQRFGRLGRAPETRADTTVFPAVVVHDLNAKDDPIYGHARTATWTWLTSLTEPTTGRPRGSDPFGDTQQALAVSPLDLAQLRQSLTPDEIAAMQAPSPYIPHLWDHTVRLWSHTSPRPHPDPPIGPFLHGLDTRPADVNLIWRGDITTDELPDPEDSVTETITRRLSALPPTSEEMLAISPAALRRWAVGAPAAQVEDVDGARELTERPPQGPARTGLLWGTDGTIKAIDLRRARPGDTVIVPADTGGCDEFGWNPDSTDPVVDVADLALRRSRPRLRIHPALAAFADERTAATIGAWQESIQECIEEGETPEVADFTDLLPTPQDTVNGTGSLTLSQRLRVNLDRIAADPRPTLIETGEQHWVLAHSGAPLSSDTDAASSSAAPEPQGLDAHQEQVACQAAVFACNLGLPEQEIRAVWAAGRYHDEGKRDPRFQAMLYGLTPEAVWGLPVRAKSGLDPSDRRAYRLAARRSTYPKGMRHEALSVAIARHRLAAHEWDVDTDLVLHLIAAHHGRARPLVPPVCDPHPVEVAVPGTDISVRTDQIHDLEQPARFHRLQVQHGVWKLALLEAVVRMADIWCSAGGTVTTEPAPAMGRRTDVPPPTPVKTHRVRLPALDGRDPLGFLTAVGTLRLLSEELDLPARLSFDPVDATATITSPLPDIDSLTQVLGELVGQLDARQIFPAMPAGWPQRPGSKGGDPIRVERSQYATLVHQAGAAGEAWLRTITTDLALDTRGRCALNPFMAPSGKQSVATFFLFPLEKVKTAPQVIGEAFTGWRRLDECTGENLDHRAIRTAGDMPTGESTPAAVPGATWLATHALPLLHLTGDGTTRQAALWQRIGRRQILRWPVWSTELDLHATRAMLTHPVLNRLRVEENTNGVGLLASELAPWSIIAIGAAARRPDKNSDGPLVPIEARLL